VTQPYLGEIRVFGFNFPPRGWATCSGQLLPIAQNTALFSLLGTFYGGNGTTNFALPDFRGRVAVSQGQGPGLSNYVIGEQAGTENNTLTTSQLPSHTHVVNATATANSKSPAGKVPAFTTAANFGDPGALAMSTQMNAPTGGGQPFSILQPYIAMNYCIAMQGIFPSRN
jgi:microcystin-dependent protein